MRGSICEFFLVPIGNEIGIEGADLFAKLHIQIDVIAALHGGLAGHFTAEIGGSGKDLFQKVNGTLKGELLSVKEEVEARLAAQTKYVDIKD